MKQQKRPKKNKQNKKNKPTQPTLIAGTNALPTITSTSTPPPKLIRPTAPPQTKININIIKHYASKYLNTLDPNTTTRTQYGFILSDFVNFIIKHNYNKLTTIRIEQFLQSYTHKKGRPTAYYFNLRLAALRSLFNFMEQHSSIHNLTKYIKSRKTPTTTSTRTLTHPELKYILRHTKDDAQHALYILAHTGIRISELTAIRQNNLKKDYINGTTSWVLTIRCKGQKIRRIQLSNDTASLMLKRFAKYSYLANTPLFPSNVHKGTPIKPGTLRTRIKRQLLAIGFPNVNPHWIRHTFAQLLHNQNINTSTIQQSLGHSSLNTTQRYLQSLDVVPAHNLNLNVKI